MKLPKSAHTSRPWRIHALAPDFRLEDVWALPTPGGPDDFPRLVRQVATGDTSDNPSWAARTLFAIRWKLGELLGWDDPGASVGSRVPSLRDRLPADLRDAPAGPDLDRLPFSSVYQTENEWAAEMANRTVHAVMHIGWVPDDAGGYRGQMAALVKPKGLFGTAYMAAIAPFRHLIVYPPLMRGIGQEWLDRGHPGREGSKAATVDRAVGTDSIPKSIRARSSLPDADYADVFTLSTDAKATPEQWARAMFGDAPSIPGQLIWRGLLGLRLTRERTRDTVAGWRVAERREDWVRLEAASWFLTGNLVVQATGGRVSLGTFLRYDRRLGNVIWPPLSAVHRRLAPGLLRDATAIIRASR